MTEAHVPHSLPALASAVLVLVAPAAALAGAWAPAPSKWLRSWDLGRDGEGEDTCTVRLQERVVAGGYALSARPNCRDVPEGRRLAAWAPTPDGGLVLNDARGRLVMRWRLDPHYSHPGYGLERRDREDRLWIMNPTLGPPPSARAKGR